MAADVVGRRLDHGCPFGAALSDKDAFYERMALQICWSRRP
jgi:hypothetical protein